MRKIVYFEVILFKKTVSPRFLIQGFPVGRRANAETGTWEAFMAMGPWKVYFPPLVRKMKKQAHKAQIQEFKFRNLSEPLGLVVGTTTWKRGSSVTTRY
jgi:hypothetical protein